MSVTLKDFENFWKCLLWEVKIKSESTFENNLLKSEECRHTFENFDNIVNLEEIPDYSKFNMEECVFFCTPQFQYKIA